MKAKLIDLFNSRFDLNKIQSFLEEHKAERIAEKYLLLFEGLIGRNK